MRGLLINSVQDGTIGIQYLGAHCRNSFVELNHVTITLMETSVSWSGPDQTLNQELAEGK